MELVICHGTSKAAADNIRRTRLIAGTGAHDFMGPGVYGSVFSSEDLAKYRAGDLSACEAVLTASSLRTSNMAWM